MRVILAEDEVLLRRGLQLVLEDGGFEVVAVTSDATGLEEAVDRHRPELVITDIRMPPTHTDEGLRAALRIREKHTDVAVVVLSQHVQRRYAHELLASSHGKVGYLLKQRIADVDTFLAGLRQVVAGGTALDPDVVAVMVARAKLSDSAVRALTPRQQQVLALMAQGHSNSRIATELFLSEKAVVQHTSRIYDALGLPLGSDSHRRVLAVMRYLSES
ncbi:DNA-binding response regulator, NarL/FixJ family, contains REC and HTH domains [Raineyella antarctica]|uniref:DNA-binding response regulator, NarL/FixJ family, contains REC and HTH domains n=1 Tax=Raineyella antarctica TaxID=1577474 RepID=A0A1G6GFC7_9ACTN|nr:response regulator transcription factor [Raineyella antarctica]SDB79856.1 DNA-binding response regulator, NarL/FixJ family, contains REC and HTH domains [Raineyella antarctica]